MARSGTNHKGGQKEGYVRPNFNHFWTSQDIKKYMENLKKSYPKSPELYKFVGNKIFGADPVDVNVKMQGVDVVFKVQDE